MLLVLQDDGVLYVYPTVEAAERDIEPLDAEECFRAVYDERAVPHKIEWLRPNQERIWFGGFLGTAINGEYRLVPRGDADTRGLLQAIDGAVAIEPADEAASVLMLKQCLLPERQ